MLSHKVAMVCSRTSYVWAMTSRWAATPACSRSLLVMSPARLSAETTRFWRSGGKGLRHRLGRPVVSKKMPPMPGLAASTAPRIVGSSGTISAIRVGRDARSRARCSKLSRWDRTCLSMRTRFPSEWVSPCCKALKRPALPGTAMDMWRSSPKIRCHCFTLIRFLPRRPSKMASRRALLCSGSSRVRAIVSRIQPSRIFRVAQAPSPLRSFLTDVGSFR